MPLFLALATFGFAQGGPPLITTQPQSQTVPQGATAAFSVVVSSYTQPNYQWRFNGANIPGATATNYVVAAAQMTNAGDYSVAITNAVGWAISSNATLTVLGQGTVQFSLASNWVNQNAGYALISVSRTGGSAGPGSVHYMTADGTATNGVDYLESAGFLTWDDGDTAVKFFTVPLIDNNLSGGSRYFTAYLSDAASVSLGDPSSTTITIVQPPLITDQPQSLAVTQGTAALFAVVADSATPLTYQWRFNGTNLSAGTASSFGIDHVQPWQAGAYSVEISNRAGSATSDDAILTVTPQTGPIFLSGAAFQNQSFQFILNGPSAYYVIEISTNLASWIPYSTNLVPQSGALLVTDSTGVNSIRRFYRARLQ